MSDCKVYNCRCDRRDILEVETGFDFMDALGFEMKGPNIESDKCSKIVALSREQVKDLIATLQQALDEE